MLHVHVSLEWEQHACYTFTCRWIRNNMHAKRSRVVGLRKIIQFTIFIFDSHTIYYLTFRREICDLHR